jgi:hypothetical protein
LTVEIVVSLREGQRYGFRAGLDRGPVDFMQRVFALLASNHARHGPDLGTRRSGLGMPRRRPVGGRLDMKLRRLVLIMSWLAGGLLTVSNPVTADVVDGNPVFTDHHQVSLSRYVNLICSKPHPSSAH